MVHATFHGPLHPIERCLSCQYPIRIIINECLYLADDKEELADHIIDSTEDKTDDCGKKNVTLVGWDMKFY